MHELTERKLKIGDSHGVATGNSNSESGVKEEEESRWKEEPWIRERQQESFLPKLLDERIYADIYQEGKDDRSIVKEGYRLIHEGDHSDWKVKKNSNRNDGTSSRNRGRSERIQRCTSEYRFEWKEK